MARERFFLFALNGGAVSPLALARTDLQRMKLTAERFENFIPRVIGPMMIRPGSKYYGSTKSNLTVKQVPFVYSIDDTAMIELSTGIMRAVIEGVDLSREAVSTSITNGNFSSSSGWTLTTTNGGVANINSTVAGALVLQTPVRGGSASCVRSVTCSAGDSVKEHGLNLTVSNGTVKLKIGTSSGGNQILDEAEYGEGVHSIAFTPGATTFYPMLSAESETRVVVADMTIDGSGAIELATPWLEENLPSIRYIQSGDVLFVADGSHQPRRIERRGNTRSWGVVKYKFVDGPWRGKSANVKLTPSVRLGNGTLAASAAFFESTMVGALFKLTHFQTTVDVSVAGDDRFTDILRVNGVAADGNARNITYAISGTWVGSVSLQYSYDDGETWQNRFSVTSNVAGNTINAGPDNVEILVRMGFQAGDYTSGTAVLTLSQPGGGGTGVVRVTGYTSSTSVSIEVVERLHHTGPTETWEESKYSDYRGWPFAVGLFEGRLWWGGSDQVLGSYVDDYSSFDVEQDGDSAPIVRSIATGPVNKVQWLLDLARLIIGTSGAESVARSSSFDEPMTPSNFSVKDASTFGSADIQAIKIDREGYFIHRSLKRAYALSYSVENNDYISTEVSRYNPTILDEGVVAIAAQRTPDTRIWNVLADGTAVCLLYEKSEDVIAFFTVTLKDGFIEDVAVLPDVHADDVWLIVRRTINGSTKRYREKLAHESEAVGGDDNYIADSAVTATLAASATVTGLTHLVGENVVVWADGEPLLDDDGNPEEFTVSGAGEIVLPSAVTGTVITGKPFTAYWKSTKLAYAAQAGTAMSQKKNVVRVNPILYMVHNKALKFGKDFTDMEFLPESYEMTDYGISAFMETWDYDGFSIPGGWSNDDRLCIMGRSPMPATILGIGITMEGHEQG